MAFPADIDTNLETLLSMILDKNEILTVKSISAVSNKNISHSKQLFKNVLKYLSENEKFSTIKVCTCSLNPFYDVHNNQEQKLIFKSHDIKEIPLEKYNSIISIQKSKIYDYKVVVNSNYKQNNDTDFYQAFLNRQISSNHLTREASPQKPPTYIISETVKKSSFTLPRKDIVSKKSFSEPLTKIKENKIDNLPTIDPKLTQDIVIFSPAVQSTQKEQCSDEEPLPKYLKTINSKKSATIKKRVLKERHYTNEKGFLVTEKKYELIDQNIENSQPEHLNIVKKVKKQESKPTVQYSLNNFFKKT